MELKTIKMENGRHRNVLAEEYHKQGDYIYYRFILNDTYYIGKWKRKELEPYSNYCSEYVKEN